MHKNQEMAQRSLSSGSSGSLELFFCQQHTLTMNPKRISRLTSAKPLNRQCNHSIKNFMYRVHNSD